MMKRRDGNDRVERVSVELNSVYISLLVQDVIKGFSTRRGAINHSLGEIDSDYFWPAPCQFSGQRPRPATDIQDSNGVFWNVFQQQLMVVVVVRPAVVPKICNLIEFVLDVLAHFNMLDQQARVSA